MFGAHSGEWAVRVKKVQSEMCAVSPAANIFIQFPVFSVFHRIFVISCSFLLDSFSMCVCSVCFFFLFLFLFIGQFQCVFTVQCVAHGVRASLAPSWFFVGRHTFTSGIWRWLHWGKQTDMHTQTDR